MLLHTPFHERTAPLMQGYAWRRWAGHAVASAYDLVPDREYTAIRNSAALIDVSPLKKYLIHGRDATRLLDRMVTRNVAKLQIGQVMYTTWCDEHGKVLDDGTITRLDERRYRLTSAEPNLRWLHLNSFGLEVAIDDISDRHGGLALQGPLARAILNEVAREPVDRLKYFRMMSNQIDGVDLDISRTGYTGDLGYELWIPSERAVTVWDALARAGGRYGMTPAGIWALDTARIEAGLLMLDVDYHSAAHALIEGQTSSPFELSLDWTVTFDKSPFNGKRALMRERARGPRWRFLGIEVDWVSLEKQYARFKLPPSLPTIPWRVSVPIYRGAHQIGYASSGCWSPLLKKYLALAHLEHPHFAPGTEVEIELTVEHQRLRASGWVARLPFFDPPRKKAMSTPPAAIIEAPRLSLAGGLRSNLTGGIEHGDRI